MQIFVFLFSRGHSKRPKPFPYLGIGKKTCYICSLVLRGLDIFRTRESHGRLHPHWTLPRAAAAERKATLAIRVALTEVERRLAENLKMLAPILPACRPESTTVWSSRQSTVCSGPTLIVSEQLSTKVQPGRMQEQQRVPAANLRPAKAPTVAALEREEEETDTDSVSSVSLSLSPARGASERSVYRRVRVLYNTLLRLLKVRLLACHWYTMN
jgi:hypothetical protein